ncbi:unnamed protein product, partial [Anisakis simplex]|uniref:Rap guanine nucleotide exchange factor (inferred by orthology to a C. elegans protein) n=1 Tax=Anisakis simplex TaxID=6269 RepID=A0A0M3JNC3_ANISI
MDYICRFSMLVQFIVCGIITRMFANIIAFRELVRGTNPLRASRSNPDISEHNVLMPASLSNNISQYYQPAQAICPEHVLKVYRADQSFKYLTVYKETTAQNVVQLALQ